MASIVKLLRFIFFCVFSCLIIHNGMYTECKVAKKKSKRKTSKRKNKKNNGKKKQVLKKSQAKKKSIKIKDIKEKQKKAKEKEIQKKVKEKEKQKIVKEREKQKIVKEKEKQKMVKEKEKQKKVKERENQKKIKQKEKQKKVFDNGKKNNKSKIGENEKNKENIEPGLEINHYQNEKSTIINKEYININERGYSNDQNIDINGDHSSLRTITNKYVNEDISKEQQKNINTKYKENKKKFDDEKYKEVREKSKQSKTQQEIEILKEQRAERKIKKKERKQKGENRKNIAKDQGIQEKNGLNNKVIKKIKKENEEIKDSEIKSNEAKRGDEKFNNNNVKRDAIVGDKNGNSLINEGVKKIGLERKDQEKFKKDRVNKNRKEEILLHEKEFKNAPLREPEKKEMKNDKKTFENDKKTDENNREFEEDLEFIAIRDRRMNSSRINSNDEFICKDHYIPSNCNQTFFSRRECESLNQVRRKDPQDMQFDLHNDALIFNAINSSNLNHNLINDESLDNQNQLYSNKFINLENDFCHDENSSFSDEFQEFDSIDGEEMDMDFEDTQVKLGASMNISVVEKDIMSEEDVFQKKKAIPFVEEPLYEDLNLIDCDLGINKHSSELVVNQSKILDFEKVPLLNYEKNIKKPSLTGRQNDFCLDHNNSNELPKDTNYNWQDKDFSKNIVEEYIFTEDDPQIVSTKRNSEVEKIICDADNNLDGSDDNYIEEYKQNNEVAESFSDIDIDDEYSINDDKSCENVSNEILENNNNMILEDSVLNFGIDNEEFDDDFASDISILNCFNCGSSRSTNSNGSSPLVINKPCISIKEKLLNSFFGSFSFILWTEQQTNDEKFFQFGGEMTFNKLHIIECAMFFGVQLKDFYLYRGGIKFKAYKDKNPCFAIAPFIIFEIGSIYLILEVDSNGKLSFGISPFDFCFLGLSYSI